ncbi:MAG: glycosyltransferase family 4 protein, partial [Anaerolineae bacterium]
RPNVSLQRGPWPLYWPHEQLAWPGLLRRHRIQLFHAPYFSAPLLAPCPMVVTVHDLIFDRFPDYMPWAWARPYYRLLMAAGTRRAHKIIAVSQATAADLTHYYHVPPSKIAAIPEGVDRSFGPLPGAAGVQAVKTRFGLARPVILAVGARRPHKNLARLVNAFARLAPCLPHELVLVGRADPRLPDEARQVAEQLPPAVRERIRFLEWVTEAELRGLYTLADVAVVPSLVEGFGLPALEAMACGTPVLAAGTSSLPEVVGRAGLLVSPYDVAAMAGSLRELIENEPLRQHLARAGRKRVATFSWVAAARRTLAVYDSCAVTEGAQALISL